MIGFGQVLKQQIVIRASLKKSQGTVALQMLFGEIYFIVFILVQSNETNSKSFGYSK